MALASYSRGCSGTTSTLLILRADAERWRELSASTAFSGGTRQGVFARVYFWDAVAMRHLPKTNDLSKLTCQAGREAAAHRFPKIPIPR